MGDIDGIGFGACLFNSHQYGKRDAGNDSATLVA